ncbi:cell wall protein Rhd3p [[Candida] railenensis]|uniref:Cell wall protein Rhd3p n=1 Tax=[Candida] railenensis TaxID=45579 RepID=A0A9P0VZ16_9ASCO|nr:cell wall protein Rhd3p [[Candida] railenensis]
MKITTLALSATTISAVLAAVYDVQLFVESSDSAISGNGLSSIHEGAGINYFLLSTGGAETFKYDDQAEELYTDNSVKYSVGTLGGYLSNGVTGSSKATFDDNKLSLGGNTTFYAAKNTGDPYNYSDNSYIVLVSNAEGSIPFSIKAVKSNSTVTTSSASGTPAVTTVANSAAKVGSVAGAGLLAIGAYLI